MTMTSSTSVRSVGRAAYVPGVHGTTQRSEPRKPAPTRRTDLGPLATIGTPMTFAAGTPLLHEGAPADHLFHITSGVVKVYRTLPDGRCQITGFLFAGDFVGLAPEDVYLSGVVAIGPVTASRIPRKKVEQLVEVSPMVARLLLQRACSELIAAQDQMLLLGRKTAPEKVASFLVSIAHRTAGDLIDLPMTRTDIADYLGLTIETVSRTLSRLDADEIIEVDRAHIRIIDAEALQELTEGA